MKITLTVHSSAYLSRQLVKSDSASLLIPDLSFEIPPGTQRGSISTIEGMLRRAAMNLEMAQPERVKLGDLDNFYRCKDVIEGIKRLVDEEEEDDGNGNLTYPFQIVLDDPAGNSFIENPHVPARDAQMREEWYMRTPAQDVALGLRPKEDTREQKKEINVEHVGIAHSDPNMSQSIDVDYGRISMGVNDQKGVTCNIGRLGRDEAISFPTQCESCHEDTETRMCLTDIPHFKEVIIMSTTCDTCGWRSNELKSGGGISKLATKITLKVNHGEDLKREVLKSDTAGVEIPELELELNEGGLGGMYTTVEGLLDKLLKKLKDANPFGVGDSVMKHHQTNDGGAFSEPSSNAKRFMELLERLRDMRDSRAFPFTVIINDPLSDSFICPVPEVALDLSLQAEKEGGNECYINYVDSGLEIMEDDRSFEQNEILGLNDMKTEHYHANTVVGLDDGKVCAHKEGYYGTDKAEDPPHRLRKMGMRGPDHPCQYEEGTL